MLPTRGDVACLVGQRAPGERMGETLRRSAQDHVRVGGGAIARQGEYREETRILFVVNLYAIAVPTEDLKGNLRRGSLSSASSFSLPGCGPSISNARYSPAVRCATKG